MILGTHTSYLSFFFTQAKFLENKIYTENRINYDKLHSKLQIFRIKSLKIYTGQKNLHGRRPWRPWQISGMCLQCLTMWSAFYRQTIDNHTWLLYNFFDANFGEKKK